MPGDLRPRGQGAQIGEGEGARLFDEAANGHLVACEMFCRSLFVGGVLRVDRAVRLEHRAHGRGRIFGRQLLAADGALHLVAELCGLIEGALPLGRVSDAVASGERQASRPGHEQPAVELGTHVGAPVCAGGSAISSSGSATQPVIMERRLLIGPDNMTITTVDDDEEDERPRHEEVNGARALAAAEEFAQHGPRRVDGRRHFQAGQDQHGNDDEQDAGIGELLQDIVLRAPGPWEKFSFRCVTMLWGIVLYSRSAGMRSRPMCPLRMP